jgi:hypothetical protein
MRRLFTSKVDHPLADAKEVRRVLNELPALEAAAALDSATAWLESLAATPEFPPEQRLDVVLQIDQAALPQSRKLARNYLTGARQSRAVEYRLWQVAHGYWAALAAVYRQALGLQHEAGAGGGAAAPQPALVCARLLHAYAGALKWNQFRYGPVDKEFWLLAGEAYRQAGAAKIASRAVTLYAGSEATTPEAEYLKILILQSSAMDSLLPIEIEIAERLIAHVLPAFSLTEQARPDNVCWVDFAKALPPTRLTVIPEITPSLRFYSTSSALVALAALRASIEATGRLPTDVNFGGQYSPRVVLPVMEHLATCWSPQPPMRSHARRQFKSRVTIVHDLAAVRLALLDLPVDAEAAESWVVEDVSQGGIGAQVPLAGMNWLKVGSLVGMRPEGGNNWLVGLVRRFSRISESAGGVGIETLSKTPRAMVADSHGLRTDIIALDPLAAGAVVRLVLSVEAWEEQTPLDVAVDGRLLRLRPIARLEEGSGYVVGRYGVALAD